MLSVVVDGVDCQCPPAIVIQWLSRIWVHIEAWEVAAGDIEPYAVAFLEDKRSGIHFYGERIDVTRLHQFRMF